MTIWTIMGGAFAFACFGVGCSLLAGAAREVWFLRDTIKHG